jgi:hypothetical protein
MSGTLACLRQISNAHKILCRKPGGKRPFGKLSSWEDNRRVDLVETDYVVQMDGTGSELCPVAHIIMVVLVFGYHIVLINWMIYPNLRTWVVVVRLVYSLAGKESVS